MLGANDGYCPSDRVVVRSIDGTSQPTDEVKPAENYWLLIGTEGVIVKTWQQADFSMDRPRCLVKFDQDVKALGLHCHNDIENSLWILETDIVRISSVGG